MHADLLRLDVRKRPARLRFDGRVLFLLDDAELVRRQLEGEDLELTDEIRAKLRDNISTDEITPAYICYYFDDTLGQFPYLGLKAGEEFPLVRGSVRAGGFVARSAARGAARARRASSRRTPR